MSLTVCHINTVICWRHAHTVQETALRGAEIVFEVKYLSNVTNSWKVFSIFGNLELWDIIPGVGWSQMNRILLVIKISQIPIYETGLPGRGGLTNPSRIICRWELTGADSPELKYCLHLTPGINLSD